MSIFVQDIYGWSPPVAVFQIIITMLWVFAFVYNKRKYSYFLLLFTIIFVIITWSLKPYIMVQTKINLLPYKDAPSTDISEQVNILGESNGWYYVKADKQFGWIEKDSIK